MQIYRKRRINRIVFVDEKGLIKDQTSVYEEMKRIEKVPLEKLVTDTLEGIEKRLVKK